MTRTFAKLELSTDAYEEIATKLRAAGYDHAFIDGAIDMHGIGVTRGHRDKSIGHEPEELPLRWYWADCEDAEQWFGPHVDKESAVADAVATIEWSDDSEGGWSRTVYLVTARPGSLTDDIFNSSDVLENWEGWNEERADEGGDLKMHPTGEQRVELERELTNCLAAWRARHCLGRAWTLDMVQHFEETVDRPCPANTAMDQPQHKRK